MDNFAMMMKWPYRSHYQTLGRRLKVSWACSLLFLVLLLILGVLNFTSVEPEPEEESAYQVASSGLTGWFKTGQEAEIVLSAIDFNNTGGPLLFNHPLGIASDGKRLVLLDSNNNRALIWNDLPMEDNTEPDFVLGQKNFTTNNSGRGLDEMNWPTAASIAGEKLVIADTENDRILIWNSFPTVSGQAADLVLSTETVSIDIRGVIVWPWGIWTDSQRLVVSSTGAGQILFWNSFPTQNNQAADFAIKLPGEIGTPRGITSNGEYLIVGDHNAFGEQKNRSFIWESFPTNENQRYDIDFLLSGPTAIDEDKLIIIGNQLYIWNSLPEMVDVKSDLSIGASNKDADGFFFGDIAGEGQSMVSVGGRIYIAGKNTNKLIGYSESPTHTSQLPDLVIGSPDLYTNTLETNYFITNPIPATDGQSLFVSSEFDRKLYIWKNIPDESGAKPDFVIDDMPGLDNHLFDNKFVSVNKNSVAIWDELPRNGEQPSREWSGAIGNVQLTEVRGVAFNSQYFFLSDTGANKVYVWQGFPEKDSNPIFALDIELPLRLAADNEYLIVTVGVAGGEVYIYELKNFSPDTQPATIRALPRRLFNGVGGAMVRDGHLAIADTGFGRILLWTDISDAINGKDPDVILGATGLEDIDQEIGTDKLFWPFTIAFDGSFLWVGEYKFSGRLLRFDVQ